MAKPEPQKNTEQKRPLQPENNVPDRTAMFPVVQSIMQETLLLNQFPIRSARDITLFEGRKLRFTGLNANYNIFRTVGDAGDLNIDPDTENTGDIKIGGLKRPVNAFIYGRDESRLGADNSTNDSYLSVKPGAVTLVTDIGNNFIFGLPNGSSDPSGTTTGSLAVISGELKIYDGADWIAVGIQRHHELVTATTDGLTTGLIPIDVDSVNVSSDDADKIVTLPANSGASVQGKRIWLFTGSTGCEVRTPAGDNQKINGTDADGTNEAAIPASTTCQFISRDTNEWILLAWNSSGVAITIVIDSA